MERPSLWAERFACMTALGATEYNHRLGEYLTRWYGPAKNINAVLYQAERTILDLWELQNR